ncbi:MAG: hypothetical protein D6679_13175 [Candidatus Hydrogenedentota bacterium]|nr:MAG: hypothetical protein D6679_13175 [Candidatus Hydrogenedentota bacterium]
MKNVFVFFRDDEADVVGEITFGERNDSRSRYCALRSGAGAGTRAILRRHDNTKWNYHAEYRGRLVLKNR